MDLRLSILAASLLASSFCAAGDWPQWRCDAGRTGASVEALAAHEELHVQWTRSLPQLQSAFRDVRLQFDRGYEPVVLGKRMFIGSSRDDCMIALDTDTGELLWRFVSGGPIRFAPVAWEGAVYFGSDDGYFYCLNVEDGSLRWKFQAVPSERQVFGNRRVISTWPVRGGPVLRDGRIYFAAGVWSFEGVFVYALDANSGEVVWLNDDCGYIYGVHPHNAVAFGGLAPQGYLLINGDELIVPSSSAYPAKFDLGSGKLLDFKLPSAGRKPGGWFVATGGDPGESKLGLLPASEVAIKRELLYERSVNQKRHEDDLKLEGKSGVRAAVSAGGRRLSFNDAIPGVSGKIHSMLVADEKLFVVTESGEIHCLGTEKREVVVHAHAPKPTGDSHAGAMSLLNETGKSHGLVVFIGLPETSYLETIAALSDFGVLAIATSAEQIKASQKSLLEGDLYGHRIAIRNGDPSTYELPPYIADIIVVKTPLDDENLRRIANSVRPFGGVLVLPEGQIVGDGLGLLGFIPDPSGKPHMLTRSELPGSTDYTGGWQESADQLVRAPLGVLWFDDTLGHFKRSPQPRFVDGVMISSDKKWLDASTRTNEVDYLLKPVVYSDVYTGRILTKSEIPMLSAELSEFDLTTVQPSQYRPPNQKDAWKPEQPTVGVRKNPLTGIEEPRTFPKSYGCDGGFDYGNLYSMRSGTAAFYDKRLESGTINLSGPRSGCTNSIIPANGVLNVPYFFEGCTCSYPLPTALALVSMPKIHEQWSSWGDVSAASLGGKIERVGINFGAPGDRMTDDGTLWLDFPNVGGPSPQIQVEVAPADQIRYDYRHSLWIEDGSAEVWPWVTGSALIGAREVTVRGLKNGNYAVRLLFAELEDAERKFGISVQGVGIESNFSPLAKAGGGFKGVVLEVPAAKISDGLLRISLSPEVGETILGGIELVRVVGGE
ncbi:MAG: hypothetical protein ACI8XO_001219 [Verrucomicrobiales bacterium]|jgi:hypothetical protein